jgi:hypothetical protein
MDNQNSEDSMNYYLHRFGESSEKRKKRKGSDKIWEVYLQKSIISVSYHESPNSEYGKQKISIYNRGDIVFVYAIACGIVGMALIVDPSLYYYFDDKNRPPQYPKVITHCLQVKYIASVRSIKNAIKPSIVKEIFELNGIAQQTITRINKISQVGIDNIIYRLGGVMGE